MASKRGLEETVAESVGEGGDQSGEGAGVETQENVKRVCPENGRPGDWSCPSCEHDNWSFRSVCQKCFVNKDGTPSAPVEGGGKKPGDWTCHCSHLNYSFRYTCQKCHAPKGPGGRPLDGRDANAPGASRPGDWACPTCGDIVYATRNSCRKCHTPKSMAYIPGMHDPYAAAYDPYGGAAAMGAHPGGGRGAPPTSRPGDWACPKCYDVNYATRHECRLCHTPKPAADPAAAYAMYGYDPSAYGADVAAYMGAYGAVPGAPGAYGAPSAGMPNGSYGGAGGGGSSYDSYDGGGGGGSRGSKRAGDWDCPQCGDACYGTRTECRKCRTPKPESLAGSSYMGGYTGGTTKKFIPNNGLGASRRAGDWDCPGCGDVQYATRQECRKCRTPKPSGA